MTVLSSIFRWDDYGVAVLGEVSGGQIGFALPLAKALPYLSATFPTALTISVVGYVDSIVAA